MSARKYWACSDGAGGYDIGFGDIATASVYGRDTLGAKVWQALPDGYSPRAEALRFRASADLLEALRRIVDRNAGQPAGVYVAWLDEARKAIDRAEGGGA